MWPVTQHCWLSVHETKVAPDMAVGRAPTWVQAAPEVVDTRATVPAAVEPTAMHQPSARQETAVRSRTVAGAGTWVHWVPPSTVVMITAWLAETWLA